MAPQELPQKIGFIGAGQMAEALARGFIGQGVTSAGKVSCTDPNKSRCDLFETFGAKAVASAVEVPPPPPPPAPTRSFSVLRRSAHSCFALLRNLERCELSYATWKKMICDSILGSASSAWDLSLQPVCESRADGFGLCKCSPGRARGGYYLLGCEAPVRHNCLERNKARAVREKTGCVHCCRRYCSNHGGKCTVSGINLSA